MAKVVLSDMDKQSMRARYNMGVSMIDLAKEYKIPLTRVKAILKQNTNALANKKHKRRDA